MNQGSTPAIFTLEAIRLCQSKPELMHFAKGATSISIAAAERVLDLSLPESYRVFLATLGAGSFGGDEYYGIINEDIEASGIPSVVAATRFERKFQLPVEYAVIASDGTGGLYVVGPDPLVSQRQVHPDQESAVWHWWRGDHIANAEKEADSFGEFFLRQTREVRRRSP